MAAGRPQFLPRTAPRGTRGFLRLLTAVDPSAVDGFQFQGQLLTPGARFDPADLPRHAVLLEYGGRVRISQCRSPKSFRDLWLLWSFDRPSGEWIQAAQMHGGDDAPIAEFAGIAHRLLHPTGEPSPVKRAQPVVEEIAGVIAAKLKAVGRDVRCYVVAGLDHYLAEEIVELMDELSVYKRKRSPRNPRYPRLGCHFGARGPALRRPKPTEEQLQLRFS
jgi:hypothetical protein